MKWLDIVFISVVTIGGVLMPLTSLVRLLISVLILYCVYSMERQSTTEKELNKLKSELKVDLNGFLKVSEELRKKDRWQV